MKFLSLSAIATCLIADLIAGSDPFITIEVPGTATSLSIGERYGLVTTEDRMQLLDTQTNTITGSIGYTGNWQTSISGTLAALSTFQNSNVYFNDASTGVRLSSVTSPSSVILDNTFQNGTTAWFSTRDGIAFSYDVTDPTNPVLNTGSVTFPLKAANPLGMAIYGTTSVVCGYGSDTLAVVNNTNKEVVGIIDLPGAGPWQTAVNADGSKWAVGGRNDNTLYFYNPYNLTVTGSVSLGASPRGISFNNNSCAVALFDGNRVNLIDPSTLANQGTVNLTGGGIRDVILNGTTGYVCSTNGNKINVFDATNFNVIGTLSVRQAYGMAIDGNRLITTSLGPYLGTLPDTVTFCYAGPGTLTQLGTASAGLSARYPAIYGTTCIVPCAVSDNVYIFDFNTRQQVGTISDIAGASAAAANGIYTLVSSQGQNIVAYINTQTATVTDTVNLAVSLEKITVSGTTGALLASGDVLYLFDATTGATFSQRSLGSKSGDIASSGTIGMVSFYNDDKVELFSMVDGSQISLIDVGSFPYYLSMSGTTALVSNFEDNTVSIIDISQSKVINTVDVGEGPEAVAALPSKGYVVNRGDGTVDGFYYVTYFTNSGAGGNAGANANQINQMVLTGNCSQETLQFINNLAGLSGQRKTIALIDSGSQQKVIQYQVEKLDLLLHKELDHELYADKKGTNGFVLGGYDNFVQQSRNGYAGYNVDHYYQLVGATHDWGSMKWLGALGASESYEKLKPSDYSAKASYYTAWGSIGVASSHKRWIYGLDGLFGYSFIDAKRNVQFLDLNAFTSHGMWNASLDARLGYKFTVGKVGFTGYDNLGYVYGHENDYTEHGAPGDNLVITDENISMIRNQLGMKIVGPLDKNLKVFTDLAWVYENYFGSNNYKQRFVGSTIVATVTQTVPTKNYARINAGFEGTHDRFDWRLAYTGLYGKALADSAISLKLGYKF